MKINNFILEKKAKICYLQILILTTAIFAFAYLISTDEVQVNNKESSINKIVSSIINFIKVWLERSKIGIVSADCCAKTIDNLYCQDINNPLQCSGDLIPSSCSQVQSCKQGCCVNPDEGTCVSNSINQTCESLGGIWKNNAACNINECKKGCCSLPIYDETLYMTSQRCSKLSSLYGVDKSFKAMSEADCIKQQKNQKEGACMYNFASQRLCKLTTKQDCLKLTNNIRNFYPNYLCSNPALNTSCIKQFTTGCIDGISEVFWMDSCGNRENIYDANKDRSWNSGLILQKNESCNSNSANIESKNCGNCNKDKGSYCQLADKTASKPDYGNYYCGDLNCVYKGKNYINGETWCDYDSFVGNGKDVVGSRSFKKICDKGIVKTEACEDFRQEVCAEKTLDNKKTAQCRINRWRECISYNSINDTAEQELKCEQNPDCDFRSMNILDAPKEGSNESDTATKMCTPKYPPGLDFSANMQESTKEICNVGNFNCTVVFRCGKCIQNCNCLTQQFTETMNDACISLGDCGAKSNIRGVVTSGGYSLKKAEKGAVSNPPVLSSDYLKNLATYAIPVPGQKILEFLNNSKKEIIFQALTAVISIPGISGEHDNYRMLESILMGALIGWEIGMTFGPIGAIIGAVIGAIVGALISAFGGTHCHVDSREVVFTCLPWQPPAGGADCGKCKDKEKDGIPCTEYRCKSLGAGCEFVNAEAEGTGQENCIWVNRTDATPPTISLTDLSLGLKFVNKTDVQAKILQENGDCLESFSDSTLNIKTDEPALCKWDFYDNLFDDLDNYIGEFYTLNHNLSLNFPNKAALMWELNLSDNINLTDMNTINEIIDNMTQNTELHIKCRDRNANEKLYQIRTCVSETDTNPPKLIASKPAQNGYFPFEKTEIPLNLFLNEPTNCRWSYADKEYGEMENEFDCKNSLLDITKIGWNCNTTIKDENNRTYYIRCADQPWKEINRNANSPGWQFKLGISQTALQIASIEPAGNIISGQEPMTIELKASTIGGAESGKSFCSYSFGNDYYSFYRTGSNNHLQIFDNIYEGNYNIKAKCEDAAGNQAEAETSFGVQIDKSSPAVSRVYNKQGNLYVLTEENADCKFSFNSCDFNWENAATMQGSLKEHTIAWNSNNIYYTRCRDLWDNEPLGCSVVVKPVDTGIK